MSGEIEYNLLDLIPPFLGLYSGDIAISTPEGLSAFIVSILLALLFVFAFFSLINFFRALKKLNFYKAAFINSFRQAVREATRYFERG
jgi:hypothetical protein